MRKIMILTLLVFSCSALGSGKNVSATVTDLVTAQALSMVFSKVASSLQTPVLVVASGATATAIALLLPSGNLLNTPPIPIKQVGEGIVYWLGQRMVIGTQGLVAQAQAPVLFVKPVIAAGGLVGFGALALAKLSGSYIPSSTEWNFMLGVALESAQAVIADEAVGNKIAVLKETALAKMNTAFFEPLGKMKEVVVHNNSYKVGAYAVAGLTATALYNYATSADGLNQLSGSALTIIGQMQPAFMYEIGYRAAGSVAHKLLEAGTRGLQWIGSWSEPFMDYSGEYAGW